MKEVLTALGATNKFLSTYIPKISTKLSKQSKQMQAQEDKFPVIDEVCEKLRTDADQLTVVYT